MLRFSHDITPVKSLLLTPAAMPSLNCSGRLRMYRQQFWVYLSYMVLIFMTVSSNGQHISTIVIYPQTTTIADGSSHVLTCNVTGDPSPEISWYFEGQKIPTESSNNDPNIPNQFSLPSFSASEEGQYYCAAESSLGKIVSSSISLKLAYFNLDRTLLPTSSIMAPNSSFVLQCPLYAVDSFPLPSASWLLDSVPVQVAYPLVLTLEYDLVFSLLRASDTGLYTCRVTNSFLNVSEDIPVAAISQPQHISTELKYIVSPTNRTVNKGDGGVSFQCIIVGSSLDLPTNWDFGGVSVTDSERISISQNTGILTIRNVRLEDTGSYSCNDAGNQLEPKPFLLTVIAPPVVTDPQSPFLQPPHGSNLSLSCASEGTALLSYSWFYNGAAINQSGAFFSDSSRRDKIELNSLASSDDGVYQCFVENSAGEDTRAFLLSVQVEPPRLITSQKDILAFVGGTFVFGCLATESPLSVYTYKFHNSSIPSSGYSKLNDTHYSVTLATKSQSGIYTCNISNSIGSVSDMFSIKIIDPTTAYSPMNATQYHFHNDTVTLACRGTIDSSYPTLTLSYKWEFNGSPINLSQDGRFRMTGNHGDLEINAVQSSDNGNYSCIALTSDTNLANVTPLETRIGSIRLLVSNPHNPPTNVALSLCWSTLSISWSVPTDNRAVNIVRYVIEYRVDNQSEWERAGERNSSPLKFSVLPSLTYEFRVYAVNTVGDSEASEAVSIDISDNVPSIFPVNVSVQPTSPSQLNLTWKIPTSDSVCEGFKDELMDHLIEYRVHSQSTLYTNYTGSSNTSYLLTGLAPFTEYFVKIAFSNNYVSGRFSQEESGITLETNPSLEPTNFEVGSYGANKIAVSFTAPIESSRNGILLGYNVTCQASGVEVTRTGTSEFIILDDNIQLNTHYGCDVFAYNSAGAGPATAREMVYASGRMVPDIPNSLNITSFGPYHATIKYDPPDGVGDLLLTLRYIYPLTPRITREKYFNLSQPTNEFTLQGLDAGIEYTVKLAGRSEDVIGFNRTRLLTLPPGRPSTPTISKNESSAERKLFIMWTVLHDGGSSITKSILQRRLLSSLTWYGIKTFSPKESSHEMNFTVNSAQFRIVIYNIFGNATSTSVKFVPPSSDGDPASSITIVIVLVVLIFIVLGLFVLLIVFVICLFSCRREHKKDSLEFIRDGTLCEHEESNIFRNLSEQTEIKKRTSFPQPSESSSDCTDNNPPSYHSNFPSKDSKVSIGSKSSNSSSSSRTKVEISQRKHDPISKGVLAQPGRVQSAKLPHKTVVFIEHQRQSSIDSESPESSQASWTNTFNRHVRDSPIPILEDDCPPLPPKPLTSQQPHPLSITTNPQNAIHLMTNSDVWDNMHQESQYPVHLISHKKSRSDELSDNSSARYEDPMDILPPSVVKSRGKHMLRGKTEATRSKSPISYLAQKFTLSPTKSKDRSTPIPSETPDSHQRAPSPTIAETLVDTVFSDSLGKSRASYPVFHQHQHTDSALSQPPSSQPSSSQPSFC